MTVDEVKRHIDKGGVIKCENTYQREEVVQFLIDIGYKVLPAVKRWLETHRNDAVFMYPGLDDSEPEITCWGTATGKQKIPFNDMEDLIIQNDTSIDECSNEEFIDAFAELLRG